MVYRHFTAHLDDAHHIHIHIPKDFTSIAPHFTLEDSTGQVLATRLLHKKEEEFHILYSLRVKDTPSLSNTYWIYDQDRNKSQLIYRGIVQTSYFDDHYTYDGSDLGSHYTSTGTSFKVWAPLSQKILLHIHKENHSSIYPMTRGEKGVWQFQLPGDWEGASYHYLNKVNGDWLEVHDPFAKSSLANGGDSLVIDLDKVRAQAPRNFQAPAALESLIYELSVRDFSQQAEAGFTHPSTFKGLVESPDLHGRHIGLDYLVDLGITHVQLMPIYDFGSVDEHCPEAVYNWGYDPVQYNVPDGSFVDHPDDPYQRLTDLQNMVSSLHARGIGLIMDVVYNHVYNADTFALQKLVPGYSYRLDEKGNRTNGTFCGNDVASERPMIRNFIRQSIRHWVETFGIDGFRFDLMGLLDMETMRAIQEDHPHLLMYGEGWKMATGLDSKFLAHQYQAAELPGIGFFSDDFRNTIKAALVDGSRVEDPDFRKALERALTARQEHFASPDQAIQYIECHDDATVFDHLHHENPTMTVKQRQAAARLGLHLVLLSQGIPFIHSGQEAFRTKKGIENTYNSPDSINRLDWERIIEHKVDTDFIKHLIAFRKAHPILSLDRFDEIEQSVRFTWIDERVLQMDVEADKQRLRVVINFGSRSYTYTNVDSRGLLVHYPTVYEAGLSPKQAKITLAAQSLVVLD